MLPLLQKNKEVTNSNITILKILFKGKYMFILTATCYKMQHEEESQREYAVTYKCSKTAA